jgi:hypothetical protein
MLPGHEYRDVVVGARMITVQDGGDYARMAN